MFCNRYKNYCWLASVVVCRLSSVVVCNGAGVRAGRPADGRVGTRRENAALKCCRRSGRPGAWMVGAPATGRVGGPAPDTARRASRVTSRYFMSVLCSYCAVAIASIMHECKESKYVAFYFNVIRTLL